MKNTIDTLKEIRKKAERRFIENSLIKRASLVKVPDTEGDLDEVAELSEAISVLENHSMQKPKMEP